MYFKRQFFKINGKWYPVSLVRGKISTRQLAKLIEKQCTVSKADIKAVLDAMGAVLGMQLVEGHSVKLDGLGTFYLRGEARKNGVATREEVSPSQFNGVKVRFIPETFYQAGVAREGTRAERDMLDYPLQWVEVVEKAKDDDDEETPGGSSTPGGTTPGGGDTPGGGGGGTTPDPDDNPDGVE